LPLITKLAEYNIGRNTIYGAERFTEDEWNRLDEYLETAQAFRKWLSQVNFFMPQLEIAALDEITPGEKELFIGLPEITPVTERFYRKIKKNGYLLISRFSVPIYPGRKSCLLIQQKILYCPSAVELRHQKASALS
jgi:hypothetical protein